MQHQIEDSRIIAAGKHVPNFSEAGTGKTHTTLEAMRLMGAESGIVIAPSIALPMWKEALSSFFDLDPDRVRIVKTGNSKIASPNRGGGVDFHVVSYGLIVNQALKARLQHVGGDVMVLDESHYLKNSNAKRTKAVFGPACTGRLGLFESYGQTLELTGTPIMRHADDMWAQLRAIAPDVLRKYDIVDYDKFIRQFCVTQMKRFNVRMPMKRVIVASTNDRLLKRILYEDIGAVRRTMAEVGVNMPPLTYREVSVAISGMRDLNAAIAKLPAAELLAKLNSGDAETAKVWRMLGEAKIDGCVDYVGDVAKEHPVLLGYWHTATGDELVSSLQRLGHSVRRVQGSTPMKEREETRIAFNAGKVDVLVGQISSMNVSWNLQECGHHVVILEDHFSPGLIEQFVKRVWRMGQERHVQCDFIKCEAELDTILTKVREGKADYTSRAIG